jgi:general secretion pathway protein K
MMTPETPASPLADTGGQVKLTIQDELGKVNLNQFDYPRGFAIDSPEGKRWTHFFMACGLEEQEASALIPMFLDWIDRDNDPQTNGGESQLYEQLDPSYMARNGPLQGIEELRLIEGMKGESWGKIAPHVTVFPQSSGSLSKLNVNTADSVALQSLDPKVTPEIAQAIIDARNKTPFKTLSDFTLALTSFPEVVQAVTGKIVFRSDVFSVRSAAVVNGVEFTVYAVLQREKGNKEVKTLYWRSE